MPCQCVIEFVELGGVTASPSCCKCDAEPGCFPSEARVSLENGKILTMNDLHVGDKVQAGKVNV